MIIPTSQEYVPPAHQALLSLLKKTRDILRRTKTEKLVEKFERRKAEKDAATDPLTGLLNRRGSDDLISRIFQNILRNNIDNKEIQKTLIVLTIDIDSFKAINDTYGHDLGDKVIKAIATETQKIFQRSTDILEHKNQDHENMVAREGGEEFTIAFMCDANKSEKVANIQAEKLRSAIENNCKIWTDLSVGPHKPNEGKLERTVTVSIGIALATPDTVNTADKEQTLLQLRCKADKALYKAKNNGRNQTWAESRLKCNITFKGFARGRGEVNFFWGLEAEFFSGSGVELVGDGVKVGLREGVEVRAFG